MDGLTELNELHLPTFGVRVVLLSGWLPRSYQGHLFCEHTLFDPLVETSLTWETPSKACCDIASHTKSHRVKYLYHT
uniref:Uncharacterized protein n=1 Tax=Loa loa TaxID=7209 RepID=A0A1I7VBV2_LOALO